MFMDSRNSLWISSYKLGLSVYNADGFTLTDVSDDLETIFMTSYLAYPNPGNNRISLEVIHASFLPNEKINLNVVDSKGQLMESHSIQLTDNGRLRFDLEVSHLVNGVYYLQIDGFSAQQLIIQR